MQRTIITLALTVLFLAALAGCGSRDTPVTPGDGGKLDTVPPNEGEENGPCYPNNTCNTGLQCVGGICVKPQTDGGPVPDAPQQLDGPVVAPDGPQKLDGPVITPDGPPKLDGPVIPPDGPQKLDAAPTDLPVTSDGPALVCSPPGFKNVLLKGSSAGAWTVALETATTYKTIGISGTATPLDAAATMDYNVSWQQVAGFVVSRPAGGSSVSAVANAMIKDVSAIFGTVTTTHTGTSTITHDGHNAVINTTFRLTLPSASDVSFQRNMVLAAVLKKSSLTGLPATWGVAATTFAIRISTVLRGGGRAVFIGAVTEAAADADASKNTRIVAMDLASTTGLAAYNKTTQNACENHTVTQPLAPVDIIWVMDESGSMTSKRAAIAASASSFFKLAQTNGLNFRMGVTNVCAPNKPTSCLQGKFCSVISTNTQHMGGTDRFLLPSELTTFQACINNPPGYEGGAEYGLQNAQEAVKRHLPRAANTPGKIRTGAQLVIITVTDEIPNELIGIISWAQMNQCTLPSGVQTNVNTNIKPYLDYFKGTTNKETKVNFYQVIGGTCGNTCNVQIAHGYKDLATALNGGLYDVCATNLSVAINKIINDIKAAAGGVVLTGDPIAASLQLAVDGKVIKRSLFNGFNYNVIGKGISFAGTPAIVKGSLVVSTYKAWK